AFETRVVTHRRPPSPTLFPYTTLFRSVRGRLRHGGADGARDRRGRPAARAPVARRGAHGFGRNRGGAHGDSARGTGSDARGARRDRKSTRLNSSHGSSSYAVFCLKQRK